MGLRWKFCRLGHGELQRVAVGDPDPTSDPGRVEGSGKCRFKGDEEISRTLTLFWCCTRELGHQGQHIAGTGEGVAAVRIRERCSEDARTGGVSGARRPCHGGLRTTSEAVQRVHTENLQEETWTRLCCTHVT